MGLEESVFLSIFAILLLAILLAGNLILSFSALSGLLIGVVAYLYFGIQPRYVGFAITLLTCLLLGPTVWNENVFETFFVVNLGIAIVLAIYFQMKADEVENGDNDSDTIQFMLTNDRKSLRPFEAKLGKWVDFSIGGYSFLAGYYFIFLIWDGSYLDNAFFSCFSAMGIQLLVIRFRGGRKGRFWASIREALKLRGGILPRPL